MVQVAEWRKYRLSDLKELRTKLASKVMRKPSEIIDLIYSYQRMITVRKELAQLNVMFKLLVETQEECQERQKAEGVHLQRYVAY